VDRWLPVAFDALIQARSGLAVFEAVAGEPRLNRTAIVIWSLMHTKGGVAKTTTCMFLGAAAVRRGVPARVVDADPQGAASSWADRLTAH
jgi:Mrp family chromosome partitioning ATPase